MFEIGNSLREARLRQGLEYADIERVTKIRPKYLRALEDEQFELLPAQTYVKGFLRSYAEFLGLDGQLYVDEYNSRYVTREEDPPFRSRRSAGGKPHNTRLESSVVLGALVGIAIVFGLVIAAWKTGDDSERRRTAAPVDTPAAAYVLIRSVHGPTRLEVRERTRLGRPRFSGTLELGREQRIRLRRQLWMWVQRPANVELLIGGRTVPPLAASRARQYLVTAAGVTPAPVR